MAMSPERSRELQEKLRQAQEMIVEVDVEVSEAFGKTNRPYGQDLAVAIRRIVFARARLEQEA